MYWFILIVGIVLGITLVELYAMYKTGDNSGIVDLIAWYTGEMQEEAMRLQEYLDAVAHLEYIMSKLKQEDINKNDLQ